MKFKHLSLFLMPFLLVACGNQDPSLPPKGDEVSKEEGSQIALDILSNIQSEEQYYPFADKGYVIIRENDTQKSGNSNFFYSCFFDSNLKYGHARGNCTTLGVPDIEAWYFLDKDGGQDLSLIKAFSYTFGKVNSKIYFSLGKASEIPSTMKYDFLEDYVLPYSSFEVDLFINMLSSITERENNPVIKSTKKAGQIYTETNILYGGYAGRGAGKTQFQDYKPIYGDFTLEEQYNEKHIKLEYKQYINYDIQYNVPNIHDGSWKKNN